PVSFFSQAEDGIRDLYVTGVQTRALPISPGCTNTGGVPRRREQPTQEAPMQEALVVRREQHIAAPAAAVFALLTDPEKILRWMRSEERRVGKEWRDGWWQEQQRERGERLK